MGHKMKKKTLEIEKKLRILRREDYVVDHKFFSCIEW